MQSFYSLAHYRAIPFIICLKMANSVMCWYYSVMAVYFNSLFVVEKKIKLILSLSLSPHLLFCRSTGQTIKMQTENLGVIYYVNKDFRNEYKGVSLQKVEKSVEEDYVSNIRNNCWKERQQSKFGNMCDFMKS